MRRRAKWAAPAALALLFSLAAPLAGQRGRPAGGGPYMGALLGAHVGIDYLFEGFVVGGQSHILVDPWGRLTLMPNAELEFRQGLRDWQANADAAVSPLPGVLLGGGLAFRNTIFDELVGRETRRGYSIFIGYRDVPAPGRLAPQVELRWSFISDLRPRTLTVGVNYPVLLFR